MSLRCNKFFFAFFALGLAACGSSPPLYGSKSCNDENQTAYVSANGNAATCMRTNQAAYIMCVRDLSLGEINLSSTADITGSLRVVESAAASAAIKLSESLSEKWSAESELLEARADAITWCQQIHEVK